VTTRALVIFLAGALGLARPASAAGLSDAETRALRDVTRRYVEAALAGDWDEWSTLLADDAVFLPPNGTPVAGRAPVREFMGGFDGMARFEAPIDEIAGGDGVAYARGRYEFAMGPGARLRGSDSGKWLTTYEKQRDGSWLIKANIWSSSRPLAVPASPDRVADERAIRDAVKAVTDALNARDYAAAATLFAEDGDLVLPGAVRVSGRAAIRAEWDRVWSTAADRRIAVTVRDIRFVGPDTALAELTAEFSSGTPARDRATYVMVRRGDRWEAAALRIMPAEEQ